jgi:L-amino acid N-acyltransferase YncA
MTTGLFTVTDMTVFVRPVEPGDAPAVLAFFEGLSTETAYRRFFGPPSRRSLRLLSEPDGVHHVAVLAVDDGVVTGVASYHRFGDQQDVADLAVVVADDHQHQGLGTWMVRRLTHHAHRHGIRRLTATVLADNRPALEFVRGIDPRAPHRQSGTSVDVEFPLGAPGAAEGVAAACG